MSDTTTATTETTEPKGPKTSVLTIVVRQIKYTVTVKETGTGTGVYVISRVSGSIPSDPYNWIGIDVPTDWSDDKTLTTFRKPSEYTKSPQNRGFLNKFSQTVERTFLDLNPGLKDRIGQDGF